MIHRLLLENETMTFPPSDIPYAEEEEASVASITKAVGGYIISLVASFFFF